MKPVESFPRRRRARIRGVLTDIDDTLTSRGRLTAQAYAALHRLYDAGLLVAPITGRPAGWCDHIARMWPVSAVVGENGAFYFHYDHERRRMRKRYAQSEQERADSRRRLDALAARILEQAPGAALASDQPYRESDLAIDFCEDVERLPESAIDRIVQIMTDAGATAKVSSIHVNGWFGEYDKLGMTRIMLEELFGVDLDAAKEEFVFVGDSPNDSPMFAFFPNSVGVANLRKLSHRLTHLPAYITRLEAGAGFAELVGLLDQAAVRN